MSVLDFIKEALYSHNCVIVPGLGGFLKEEERSSINAVSGLFKPASMNIAFNPSLTKDDGLLKSDICIGLQIAQSSAEEMITIFVQEIKEELNVRKYIFLEGLGKLEELDDQLVYSPHELENFNIEEFGLPNFKVEKIDRNIEDMKKVRPVPAKRVVRRKPVEKNVEATQATAEKSNATITEKKQAKKEENEGANKKAIFWILPIILLIGAGSFIGYKLLTKNNETELLVVKSGDGTINNEASLVGSLDSNIPASEKVNGNNSAGDNSASTSEEPLNELSSNADAAAATATEKTVEKVEEIKEEEVKASSSVTASHRGSHNGDYHAIAGVFSSRRNAEKYAIKHSATVLEINGLYKVSVASYPSQRQAINNLSNLRSQHGSEIWITKK